MANQTLPGAQQGQMHSPRHSLADFRAQGPTNSMFPATPQPGQPPGVNGHGFAGPTHRRNGTGQGSNGGPIFAREAPAATKNTSHVPCRFFMVGNCQAGKACPFSHATENINNPAPCKYFAKGNCKYGYRCANPHLMADGTDARKMQHGRQPFRQQNQVPFHIGPPADAGLHEPGQPGIYNMPTQQHPLQQGEPHQRFDELLLASQNRPLESLSNIDSTYNSRAPSQYGSPPAESRYAPTSPPMKAMDATIPPTFDSNGAINFAFDGPASLPSRFGFGTSSATTSTANSQAFANLDFMARRDVSEGYNRPGFLASSPPGADNQGFPSRVLHSDRFRQPDKLASSLPMSRPIPRSSQSRPFADESSDDENLNLLPDALSDEIMTPEEKMRRFSRQDEEAGGSVRHSLSNIGSLPDSKFGSPTNASPSGWGPIFARKPREESAANDFSSSPYGHVGSPLRNSSLHPEASPSMKAVSRPRSSHPSGDVSPFGMSSPPDRERRSGGGLGMLSQQLKNTRLRDNTTALDSVPSGQSLQLPPTQAGRSVSQTSAPSSSALTSSKMDRAVSSTSITRSDRIDEEPSIFEMEEEDLRRREQEKQKRLSGQSPGSPWNNPRAELGEHSGRSRPGLGLKTADRSIPMA